MKCYKRFVAGRVFHYQAFYCGPGLYLYVVTHEDIAFILLRARQRSGIVSPVPGWIKDLEDELEEATEGML